MGFQGNRIYIIIICLALLALIIAVALSASGSHPSSIVPPGKVCTVTVNADIGVASIKITNQKTMKTWLVLPNQLPYSFNCTSGDVLSFNASAKTSFAFNVWYPNSGIPDSDNPCFITVNQPFTLTAQFKPET